MGPFPGGAPEPEGNRQQPQNPYRGFGERNRERAERRVAKGADAPARRLRGPKKTLSHKPKRSWAG